MNTINYGDLVIISNEFIQNDNKYFGFISTKGFNELNVFLESILSGNNNVNSIFNYPSTHGLFNYRDFIFEIVPKLNFDAKIQYYEFLKNYNEVENKIEKVKDEIDKKELNRILIQNNKEKQKLEYLKKNYKKEEKNNNNKINFYKGKILKFDELFMLKHYDSDFYLEYTNKNTKTKEIAQYSKMKKFFTKNSFIKIIPKYQSKKKNDPISYNDVVLIKNRYDEMYLDVTLEKEELILNKINIGEEIFNQELILNNQIEKKYKVIFSNKKNTSWKFIKLVNFNEVDSENIIIADLVRIEHTENNYLLETDYKYKFQNPEIFLKEYNKKNKGNINHSISSVWEINKRFFSNEYSEFHTNCDTLYLRNMKFGKSVHLMSYNNGIKIPILSSNSINQADYEDFYLEPIVKNKKTITNNNTYYIKFDFGYLKLEKEICLEVNRIIKKNKNILRNNNFIPLNDEDLKEKKYLSFVEKQFSSQNAYTIKRISDLEKKEILYLRSCMSKLYIYKEKIISQKNTKNKIYNKIKLFLNNLLRFIYDDDNYEILGDIFLYNGVENQRRQSLIKDFGIIDILIEIINKPFKNKIYKLEELTPNSKIFILLKDIYIILIHIFKNNFKNHLYLSQWINVFLNQSTMTKYFNDINSKTIKELLENNKIILKSKINNSIIYKYIQLLEDEKKLRFLNIMRVITICNKKPMYQYQKTISIIILKSQKKIENFIFDFRQENLNFFLIFNGNKKKEVNLSYDFENIKKLNSEELQYRNFIIGIINFFADLSYKRNYIAIRVFKNFLPFKEFFLNILLNNLIPLIVKTPILKFLRRLWLDIYPNKKINSFNKLIVLNENNDKDEEKYEKNNIKLYKENLLELKRYLKDYILEKSDSKINEKVIEMNYLNEILETILLFFKFQLFDQDDLKFIYNNLKNIIKNKINILKDSKKKTLIKNCIEEFFEIIVKIFKYMINFEFEKKTNYLFNTLFNHLEKQIVDNFKFYYDYLESNINSKVINNELFLLIEKILNVSKTEIMDDRDFNEILFDMTLIDSVYIISKSIYWLNLIHSKYELLKHYFLSFQLIDNNNKPIYISLRDTSNYIFKISETLDLWFIKQDEKVIKKLDYFLRDILIILNDNQLNPIYLKDNSDPYRKIYVNELYFENIYKIINRISKKNQMKTLKTDITNNLWKIIKYTNFNYDTIGGNHLIEKINIILLIISRIIYNNKKIGEDLVIDIFDIIIEYFEKDKIATNCYILLNNLIKIYPKNLNVNLKKLINNIIKKTKNFNTNQIEKAYSLNLLSILIKNSDEYNIISIQNYILKMIVDINNKELFYFIKSQDIIDFNEYLTNKENVMEISQGKFLFLPQKLCYAISFIKLLRCFTIAKNNFTENICQNYLKIKEITQFLNIKNLHILYKLLFFKFFKNTYLETERNNIFHINEIINHLLKILVDEFIYLFKYFINNNMIFDQNKYDKLYYVSNNFCLEKNEIRKKLLILLTDCIYLIIDKRITLNKDSIYYKNYNYMVKEILKVNIDKKKNKKLRLSDKSYQEKIDSLLLKIIENSPEYMEEELKFKVIEQSNLFINALDKNIENDKKYSQNKLSLIKKVYKKFFNCYNYEIKKKVEIDNFMNNIINLINNKKNNEKIFNLFFNNLIKYLKFEINKNNIKKKGFQVVLIIFRKYIEFSIPKKIKSNIVNLEYNIWNKYIDDIILRQNKLLEINTIELILELIIKSNDIEILEETINLSIALLLGGNKKCQEKFYTKIIEYNNIYFFKNIYKKINNILIIISNTFERESLKKIKTFIFDNKKVMNINESLNGKMNFIKSNFRFFQLLCEGHNIDWQNFLRTQKKLKNNSNDIDFISFSSHFFGSLVKFIRPEILDFSNQILDFMIESNQGPCKKNQKSFFYNKVIDHCKDLMNEFLTKFDYKLKGFQINNNYSSADNYFQMNLFFLKVIKFINSIWEGNCDKNIIKYISKTIELDYLLKKLKDIFKIYLEIKYPKLNLNENINQEFHNLNKNMIYDDYILEIFEIYYLLQVIFEYYPNKKIFFLKNLKNKTKWSYNFFEKNTGNVEIIFENKLLTQYFIIQPCCFYLDHKIKEIFLRSLNRNSAKDKLNDIMNQSLGLFDIIEHRFNLFKDNKNNIFTPSKFLILRRASFILSIILNLFILITYEKKFENGILVNNISSYKRNILYIFASIQLTLWLLTMIFWFYIHLPIILIKKWRNTLKKFTNKENHINFLNKKEVMDIINENIKNSKEYRHFNHNFFYYYKSIVFIVDNKLFFYFLTFIIFSFISLIIDIENCFIYSIYLLDIIYHFQTIKNIILAITNDKAQLLLSTFLSIIILFFFAEFAFFFLYDDFYNVSIEGGETLCKNMYQCFISILYWGPRLSGSIGDQLIRPSFITPTNSILPYKYIIRYFFDLLIFIWINIIFLNLIFGVIIDTFAKLRDNKKFIDYEILNKCNICSLDRFIFDKNNKNFDHHTEKEHNIWNYIFYIYYLKNKEITENTGIESFIQKKITTNDVFWLPIHRIKGIEFDEKKINLDKKLLIIDNFIKKIKKLNKIMQPK